MSIEMKVVDINISKKKGECKAPVAQAVFIAGHGIETDAHAGGWHRQVSLLANESINKMRDMGLDLTSGDFAENITTQGIQLHTLPVGTVLKVGNAILRVTQIGKECHSHCAVHAKVGMCVMPSEGIFTEVLLGGTVFPGDSIDILEDYEV